MTKRGDKVTGCEAIYGNLRWISLENRRIEKKLVFGGRVTSLEQKSWARQDRNKAEEKRLPRAYEYAQKRITFHCQRIDVDIHIVN